MDVRSRTSSGAAGQRNNRAGLDFLSDRNEKHGIMPIAGNKTVAMVDFNQVTVAIDPAGHGNLTGCRCPNGNAVVDADIDSFMEAGTPANRITSISEFRRNGPGDRPNRRHGRCAVGTA